MILLIVMNLAYAMLFPLSKIALYYSSAMFLTGFRMTFAGLLVLLYQYLFRRKHFHLPRHTVSLLLLGGFSGIYLTNVLDFWGFTYMTATKSCFLYNLYPFAAAFFGWLYFQEVLTLKKWIGLGLGFLGALPMIFGSYAGSMASEQVFAPETFPWLARLPLPEIAVLVAVVFSTYGCVVIRRLVCEKNYDSVMTNGLTMVIGGIMALVHSLFIDTWNPLPVSDINGFLASSFGMMLVSNLIGNSAYIELLKKYSITFLSFTAFSEPLITAILDRLFFGTSIPKAFYLSVAIVFVGLYLFYKDELGKKKQTSFQ